MSDPQVSAHQVGGALAKAADVLSVGVIFGAIVNLLPAIAAGLSIVWTCIRIYETRTIQGWLLRRRSPPHDDQ